MLPGHGGAQLIIFDTNALNLLPHDGPRADIIRKLRESGHHRVAVPWMVLEEMAAHKAKLYPVKHQSAVTVLRKLQAELPWELQSSLEPLDLERLLNHWRGVYGKIFEVIETSGDVALRALAREAMALPPAKRAKDHSEGARDVAIWFSILEFLKANPDQHVCFVTDNSTDFGDGTLYPYPMDEDIQGMEDRLTRLADFNEVIARFTKDVSGQDAEAAADRLLRSMAIRSQVAETAVEILSSATGFVGLGGVDGTVRWQAWVAAPETELLTLTEVTGHEIEGDVWYTAKAQWLLYGAVDGSSEDVDAEYIACVWETKVLFSAGEEDQTPTLLRQDPPSLPDTGDERCMDILRKLKANSAEAAQRAFDLLSAHSSGAAAYIAQQMAARPAATIAQIAGANRTSTLMQQVAAANLKLGSTQSLIGSLPISKLDVATIGIGKTAVEQLLASIPKSTLDIASIMPSAGIAQSILASLPKSTLDIAGLGIGKTAAQQFLASMPKSTLGLGIGETAVGQFLASMPNYKLAGYPYPSGADQSAPQDESDPDDSAEDEDASRDQD